MKKLFWTWTLVPALALAVAPLGAEAQQSRNWLVCGGNHFDTCASVFVTVSNDASYVGESDVQLKIWNLSGLNETFDGTVFTKIGFFSTTGSAIAATTIGASTMTSGGTINNPDDWQLGSNDNSGGIELELAVNNGGNVTHGIANDCNVGALPGGQNSFWVNPCATESFANDFDAAGWVTISFAIDGQWNLASTEMLIKGQNGPDGLSTQCITGAGGNCAEVPEPSTWLLLATGLGGLGFVQVRRRRREEGLEEAA